MENARTTSSAAARAAPPSATCPMVTHGRPARGRGGAQGGGGIAWVPGRGTLPDPRTIGKVLGGWNQIARALPRLAPGTQRLGPGDIKASLSRAGGGRGKSGRPPPLAVFGSLVHDGFPGTHSSRGVVPGGPGTRFRSFLLHGVEQPRSPELASGLGPKAWGAHPSRWPSPGVTPIPGGST